MNALLVTIFVLCSVVTIYIYFGYPLLLLIVSRLRPRPARQADVTPFVSIVVPLYNEESVVERKVRNSLAVDYPREKLELILVSDGSTDRSVEIAQQFAGESVRILVLPRGGKAAALNRGVETALGEIVVLTDANVDLAPDSLRKLVRWYADPGVGGVSGRKVYVRRSGADTTEVGENLYWRYDQWQKELESSIGSIFAADGTLYSLRKSLYVPMADPAQADDIAISTRVVLQGSRLLFDREAIAYEEAPVEGRDEFRRKIRVTNHSVRALLNLGSRLWTSGFYSVELLSHKLIRHLVPFFLMPLLLVSGALAIRGVHFLYTAALIAQTGLYLLAAAGALLRHAAIGQMKIFSVPYYFCLVNVSAFLGVLSIIRGRRVHAWTPRGV